MINCDVRDYSDQIGVRELERNKIMRRIMKKNYIIGVLFVLLLTASYFVFDFNSKYTDSLNEYNVLEIELGKQISDTNNELEEQNLELLALKDSIECSIVQDISYTSNSSASDSLKAYVEDTEGNVVKAEWNSIWSNTKDSIHQVSTSDFLFVFIVYFDEFGFQEGTWHVGGQCWVDPH